METRDWPRTIDASKRSGQKMMSEHMSMMQKTMGQMQTMKPRDNMMPQEQKEWIAEHQKLMDMMTGQMMDEHHLMMQMNCK
jgi:hypothetical protein